MSEFSIVFQNIRHDLLEWRTILYQQLTLRRMSQDELRSLAGELRQAHERVQSALLEAEREAQRR